MIKLELNSRIEAAAKRAIRNHNFVARIADGQYVVVSGTSQKDYQVTFYKGGDGHAWATCNCPAGQQELACHHIISAGWLHKGLVRLARQRKHKRLPKASTLGSLVNH